MIWGIIIRWIRTEYRHGKTVWNTEKRTQGQKSGTYWARYWYKDNFQEKFLIDEVYSSDLKRSYETAKIIVSSSEIALGKDLEKSTLIMGRSNNRRNSKNYSELYSSWQPTEEALSKEKKL